VKEYFFCCCSYGW